MPVKVDLMYQLSAIGFGNPASRCSNLIIFIYCLTDEELMLRARYAAYCAIVFGEAGTGGLPTWAQKSKYLFIWVEYDLLVLFEYVAAR
jgi:hypothetical protein